MHSSGLIDLAAARFWCSIYERFAWTATSDAVQSEALPDLVEIATMQENQQSR